MCVIACMPALAVGASGCGGTTVKGAPQDTDEKAGNYPVSVETATFPLQQKLAQTTTMRVVVRNAGDARIPNIAVTVQCPESKDGQNGSFDRQIGGQEQPADKNRPNFVVDQIPGSTRPASRQQLDPLERSTAYVNTYALGPLGPNRTATFEWKVTAVRAGLFRVCYRVAAGLDGKAKASPASGSLPLIDDFTGNVERTAPRTGVADDGTITTLPEAEVPAK